MKKRRETDTMRRTRRRRRRERENIQRNTEERSRRMGR